MASIAVGDEWIAAGSLTEIGKLLLNEQQYAVVRTDLKVVINDDYWTDDDLNKLILGKGYYEDYDDTEYDSDVETPKQLVGKAAKPGLVEWEKEKFLFLIFLGDHIEEAGRRGEINNFKKTFNKPDDSVTVQVIGDFTDLPTHFERFLEANSKESSLRVIIMGHGQGVGDHGKLKEGWGSVITSAALPGGQKMKVFLPNGELRRTLASSIEKMKPAAEGNINIHYYYCFAPGESDIPRETLENKTNSKKI